MTPAAPPSDSIETAGASRVAAALRGAGLWFDVGIVTVRVRSNADALASQLTSVYRHFPFVAAADWADLHVELPLPWSIRRWLRPQVHFRCDGQAPFEPFPADMPLPLMEWGANWLIGRRINDVLLLHASIVERDGLALVMPALPGSGKSTLSAALSLRGWRLLSDEFGAFDPEKQAFRAALKPVALKNASIGVIRAFAPQAQIGPEFPKTRKGTVAHLSASPEAVARVHETARPGAIVLPRWQAGSPTRWEPVQEQVVFSALAFNAFNYSVLGAVGFRAVTALVRQCPAWQLIYSDLDEALGMLAERWPAVVARQSSARS